MGQAEPGLVCVKILFILTYYRPHVSGLTIYVERLARALAARGHEVTVLTSRYNKSLPAEEIMDGVRVVRVPVWLRFNKGVLMPGFPGAALREIGNADVVSIHLPQVEAALTTFLTRLRGRKPLITYHCDLEMPPVWYGKIVDRITYWNNLLAGKMADTIVAYTADFARHSPFLSRFAGPELSAPGRPASRNEPQTAREQAHPKGKVRVILPPVVIPNPTPEGVDALRKRIGMEDGDKVVGFAARFAYEKGAGYLINAIPQMLKEVPCLKVVFAGPYGKDVIGETIWDDLQPLIKQYKSYLTFLGTLNPEQMANFFALCDVVTVASINNTESFGLVQVESFMCGTPVVATNLPGVRQPVTMTGMGEIVPIADAHGLAAGLVKVLQDPQRYVKPRDEIMQVFEMKHTVDQYEALFKEKRVR
jgi:glycosyltransferase involved in cell wall biosynthesis